MAIKTQDIAACDGTAFVVLDADAPHQACLLHSSVADSWATDQLGAGEGSAEFELAGEFVATREAPGRARRMLVATLRRKGYGDTLVHDAALVLTELAANAVLHGGSPFSVSISLKASKLRIAVGDRSPLTGALAVHGLTPRAGRGLGLIDTVSTRWGTTIVSDGKVVWAELQV